MLCQFNINFKSRFGENLYLKYSYFKEGLQPVEMLLPMEYQEPNIWQVSLALPETEALPQEFSYTYEVHKNEVPDRELQTITYLDLKKQKAKQLFSYLVFFNSESIEEILQ